MRRQSEIKSADQTWLDVNQDPIFHRFLAGYLSELPLDNKDYQKFLADMSISRIHNGYFSIDKKKRLVDPTVKKRGEEAVTRPLTPVITQLA